MIALRRLSVSSLSCLLLTLGACGDDESGANASATASGTDTSPSTTSGATDSASDSASQTNTASDSNSGTGSTSDGPGTNTATATGDTTTGPTTGMTSSATDGTTSGTMTATTGGTGDTDSTGGTTSGSTGDTTGGMGVCQGMGGGSFDFSYIWIANSPQGTVSKIDTQTAVELARYNSGPAGATDPSRTSVSSDGRFAVVANRNGGLTMIAAEEDDCVDANANGTIETSNGPGNILPWGSDECVLWNISLPASSNQGPRPVSWTIGAQDPITCEYAAGDVWIGWYSQAANTGYFRLVEGMTGNTLDEVEVPNWSGQNWGPYGGAIDGENNFWVIGWGQTGPVVRIDGQTHDATHYGNPGGWIYGMGLDLQGNTWASGCGNGAVYRFVADTETWETVLTIPNQSCLRGLQVDSNGVAWIARNGPCGLAAIDTSVEPPAAIDLNIPVAGCSTPVGVSIDAEGYVWVVDQGASAAFKVDPDTYQVVSTVNGLQSPYTYSDMTGAGINNQIPPT